MKYCCYVWTGSLICFLDMLNKAQKQIFRTVGTTLAAPLNPCLVVVMGRTYIFFTGVILVDVHLKWLSSFHIFILVRGLLVFLVGCMIFLSPYLSIIKMSMSIVSCLTQLGSEILCL